MEPSEAIAPPPGAARPDRSSLSTAAARNLSSTTKTPPQMREITPRWLLRMLPWVATEAATYRVNRRMSYRLGDDLLTFLVAGSRVSVLPPELRELPLLRGCDDPEILAAVAAAFRQREYTAGERIVSAGRPADRIVLVAHGKVAKLAGSGYGDEAVHTVWADGNYFGDELLAGDAGDWAFTARTLTDCTVLELDRQALAELDARVPALREHVRRAVAVAGRAQNKHGEAAIAVSAGHDGEPELPGTFVDYEATPREYELSVAQTMLRVHTRVADLYNGPMDQVEQQLRLTVEALRERQEYELLNNADFGLLHNADLRQRIHTRTGPPTPDDLDNLISRRRKTRLLLAHPAAIAAFGRQCNERGIYPAGTEVDGRTVRAWRGIPLLPCDKVPVDDDGTSVILAMRTGQDDQGVVGLHQTGIADEYRPGLSVRFMGIDEHAVQSYLVGAYYSAAVLVPDALGILENVETTR